MGDEFLQTEIFQDNHAVWGMGFYLLIMTTPFVPHQPEKMIRVEISAKEADLIKKLRKYSFGKFTIHKANGILVRIVSNDSQMIDEKGGLELAIE